ncbi:hypothetical protein WL88_25325 [Burkholderia diffusa]|uniref:Uncharacterized protein n=1 Tax=Burkholderia diffusa TaxID=488732 RepID=A0AAW3P9N6_9BURK|nr:hypothetical protein WL85_10510 [Burkholderia diffusa]KWF46646.1 hypothetical protein WL88_25325 [Burkholderia diffusa]KWF50781.1 hypothetical protein WL87_16590 [Burkholderia diffusa]
MGGRGEGFVGNFGQESGGGPDADSRHAGQDRPKRVSKHQSFNLSSDFVALLTQGRKLLGQTGHDDGGGLRAGHGHGLFAQCLNDLGRQAFAHARSELGQAIGERLLAGAGKRGGRRIALKQIEYRWMVKARSENTLERRMDLSKQAANAVAGLRDLSGEVVIEAAEHGEFGELLVGQSKRAQRMRHRASGFGDDGGVAGIGLCFAGVQISDAAHGQSGQIGDEYAFSAGDGYRKRTDGGRLIDDEQQSTVSFEFGDEGAQLGLVVG